MCVTCGCGDSDEKHEHQHTHQSTETLHLEQQVLTENAHYAEHNREFLQAHNIFAINIVASPGAGKTMLLSETAKALKQEYPVAAIVGDQQTDNDATRLQQSGLEALQIETGKVCHLDAHHISHALIDLKPKDNSLLFIENVGNLVCPALFDLGEAKRVVLLSVTEGEDKPLKYPYMFGSADLVIITKVDLLPYLHFDLSACLAAVEQVNPTAEVIQLSNYTQSGLDQWIAWLLAVKSTQKKSQNVNATS